MYEWDAAKSVENKKKHGISFEEARDFVFEARNIVVPGVAYEKSEVRHAVCGKFENSYFTGIFTVRDKRIRIISVRRARPNEEKSAKEKGI